MTPAAVVFDLDGVLVESEATWNDVRHELTLELGGSWRDEAQARMMGMSSTEWSSYMHDELGIPLEPERISERVVAEMERRYRERLPLIPGALPAAMAIAERWPVGIASSANRPLIDLFLSESGLSPLVGASVSSEEVARGKPAPDVYLRAAAELGVEPPSCVAVEDSSNGLRSAAGAGMTVVAVPNADFPPAADALALAAVVLDSIEQLTPELVDPL